MSNNKKSSLRFVVVAVALVVAVYMASRSQIESPGRAFPVEIYFQTADMLMDEFGYDMKMKEFKISSGTDKVTEAENDIWYLRGNHVAGVDELPWRAIVQWPKGAPEAKLLELESNGIKVFPDENRSELVFDADETLRMRIK